MISGIGSQVRLVTITSMAGSETRPIGLDFGAVMMMGAARGVDLRLLSEILPRIEAAIIAPADEQDQPDPEEPDV